MTMGISYNDTNSRTSSCLVNTYYNLNITTRIGKLYPRPLTHQITTSPSAIHFPCWLWPASDSMCGERSVLQTTDSRPLKANHRCFTAITVLETWTVRSLIVSCLCQILSQGIVVHGAVPWASWASECSNWNIFEIFDISRLNNVFSSFGVEVERRPRPQ